MTALLQIETRETIFDQIVNHPAWHGELTGLCAEKMLRGQQTPFLFMIRQGEASKVSNEQNYYITFLDENLIVRHQALTVTDMVEGLYFENGQIQGPFLEIAINEIIPAVIYCEQGEIVPFVHQSTR